MKIVRKKLQQKIKFKNNIIHLSKNIQKMNNNNFCIYAKENGIINIKHLETIRIMVNRRIKKLGGKLIIKIIPNTPITKKSTGVRMGKGKGPFKDNIYYIKIDQILFEFKNIPEDLFMFLFKKIKHKLPIKISTD